MTDRHVLFVGHFLHDGEYAEITVDANTGFARPCVTRKVTREELKSTQGSDHISESDQGRILELGYLELDFATCDSHDIRFVSDLASQFSCDLLDGTFRVVPLREIACGPKPTNNG